MGPLLHGIIITVIGGIVLTGILYALKIRFDIVPKIEIKYLPDVKWHPKAEKDKFACEWKGSLVLYNPTSNDAYEVTFLPTFYTSLPQPILNPPHLSAKKTAKVPFNVQKIFNRTDVFPHENKQPRQDLTPPVVTPLRDFFPQELNTFSIVVRYKNCKGLRYYSLLRKSGDSQICTTHRIKPNT